jgi:hypothetical protein
MKNWLAVYFLQGRDGGRFVNGILLSAIHSSVVCGWQFVQDLTLEIIGHAILINQAMDVIDRQIHHPCVVGDL